jgi:tricorn protease
MTPLSFLSLIFVAQPSGPANLGYYMQPSLRGDTVVFVSQGDLWEVGTQGGSARLLTSHTAPASSPSISPDGKSVAFSGTYEGPNDIYWMPLTGDVPKRLTYSGYMHEVGWTPDGHILAASTIRSTLADAQLLSIDPSSRRQSFVPLYQASDGTYDPSGKTLFFTRFSFQGSSTKRYKGGTAQNIWKYSDGAAEAIPLTQNFTGTSKGPMWWNHRVYFLTDRDGSMNLWSMNEDGGDLKELTHYVNWDIQSASLDSGRIVYQLGADLHIVNTETGRDRTLDITLTSDFDQSRERWIKDPAAYLSSVAAAPDGSKIALTARGQVFVAPAEPGRLVEVTRKPGVRFRDAMFTADGKSLLALSDETGETEWWKLPINGVGVPEQITHGAKVLTLDGTPSPDGKLLAYTDHNQTLWLYNFGDKTTKKITDGPDGSPTDLKWSADSQWLAYTMPTKTFSRVTLYSLKTSTATPVTTDRSDAYSPVWSSDGKWLYFLSDRNFQTLVSSPWGPRQPEPFFDRQTQIYAISLTKGLRFPFQPPDELSLADEKPAAKPTTGPVATVIDLDGIVGRLWQVPVPAGDYSTLRTTDGKLFVLTSTITGAHSLASIEIANKDVAVKTLAGGVSSYDLTADGKKLIVNQGPNIYIVDANGPVALEKPVDLSGWSFAMQPREEWRQMFIEAWRLERDFFYDPKLHSVDWDSVLKRYLPLVDRVRDRQELSNLISQVVGELSALHTFVFGGDMRGPQTSVSSGWLGAVLTPSEAEGGYRVDRIYESDPDYPTSKSPLLMPGVDVSVGDIVTQVNGVDTKSAPSLEALLRNQADKQVLLHVKDGKTGKERDCIVKPISVDQFDDLKYTDWEQSRREMVDKLSGGNIGYVHLRAMGSTDMDQWERDFYPNIWKSGLIVDVRHNGGGNIDSWIIEKLLRKAWFYWQPRVGDPSWNMQWAFRGHVVILCDENTASDGEAFTEGIKRLHIGKVIGTRTWGGEVWLGFDNLLVDGGLASAAELGVYGPEGKWLIEGHGVDPDIIVDNLPHATFLGKDAQLTAGIDELLKEIKEHPVPVPPTPPYPDKSFHPGMAKPGVVK